MRRRAAGFTALGATLTALAAIVAFGPDVPQPARAGADMRASAGGASAAAARPAQDSVPGSSERRARDTGKPAPRRERAPRGETPLTLPRRYARVVWRDSRALGRPTAGALIRATKLPAEGRHFFSWDPELKRSPGAPWRRYATDRLIRVVLRVADEYARANPDAPRLAVGDLSRRRGGHFGARYSKRPLHASHQNGLDADIYYPRRDRRERAPWKVKDIDHGLAQDLVDRFVRAGATYVFVGPRTALKGPRGIVMPLTRHDNHLHVRLPRG